MVFLQKAENFRGNGRGLEYPGRRRSGRLDLKGKGVEGQADKALFLAEESEGPGCAIARIAYHGMASKPGVAPDLVLAAGHKVALNERVMSASAKNPVAGLARGGPARAFGKEAATRLL